MNISVTIRTEPKAPTVSKSAVRPDRRHVKAREMDAEMKEELDRYVREGAEEREGEARVSRWVDVKHAFFRLTPL